ncbi:hairy-related 3 [Syngnathoides biaculeatus]|uniref:hairy-related 3 n=1 Tax=Syngnathoides biaculeatus TaxID=300417 RepID=UPI002ADD3498|nr:hairy-related 3 [Syngnathoides biaculeatus]
MEGTANCVNKSDTIPANKVSKPLMEKKRRARINKCLDQLKCLLESHYSSSIRKRKLEKADILELTVRHLKYLKKSQACNGELSDYQKGFHSCLANFNRYLLTDDKVAERERIKLALPRGKLADIFRTPDSGAEMASRGEDDQATPRRIHDASHFRQRGQSETRWRRATQQVATARGLVAGSTIDAQRKPQSKSLEVGSPRHIMWRPW